MAGQSILSIAETTPSLEVVESDYIIEISQSVGPTGPAGADGADGAQGPTGPAGADGIGTLQSVGDLFNTATSKATPANADMIGLMDSAAGNILKKLSWANLVIAVKAAIKTILGFYDTSTVYVASDGSTINHSYSLGNAIVIYPPTSGTFTLNISDAPALTTNADTVHVSVFAGATVPTFTGPTGVGTLPLVANVENIFILKSFNIGGNVWRVVGGNSAALGYRIAAATEKAIPVAADKVPISDSEASGILKWLSFTTLANTIKTLLGLREVLSAARTYYIRTDGSDSNTGLADTAGGAFLTLQKAFDVVGTLDVSVYDVTIQIGDGTYTAANVVKSWVGAGSLILQGNATTPANTVITSTTGAAIINSAIGGTFKVKNFKVTTTGSGTYGLWTNNGASTEELGGMDWGACVFMQIGVTVGGRFRCATQNRTISGGSQSHLYVSSGGNAIYTAGTTTVTGTPAFSVGFVYVTGSSWLLSYSTTFSGLATGKRYAIDLNGVNQTFGAGANYFPGDAAGTTATGGQYV